MAQYTFRLDNFRIDTTRARHNDTDYISLGLQVGGTKFPVLTKFMGDLNNGVYFPGLQFGPIEVADNANIPVIFSYQILNKGHGDNGTLDALRKLADELINKATQPPADPGQPQSTSPGENDQGTSNFVKWAVGEILRYAVDLGLGLLFVDCDGPVAVDTIRFDGHSLNQLQAAGHSETRQYVIESQAGCGDSGNYKVTWSVVPQVVQPPVTYKRITSKLPSHKVLDVVGLSQADGANVQQYTWNSGENQLWALVQVEPNYVKIVNQNSRKVLDVAYADDVDGANVQQYKWNGGDNQKWLIEPVDAGYVKIQSKLPSHKVLDVVGLSQADGANVQLYKWNGGDNQKWKIG